MSNRSSPRSLSAEAGLVLPGEQNAADAAPGEGGGGAAGRGVEHGDPAAGRGHEVARVPPVRLGPGPGGEAAPPRAA